MGTISIDISLKTFLNKWLIHNRIFALFYFDRGFTFHTHHAINYSIQTQVYKRKILERYIGNMQCKKSKTRIQSSYHIDFLTINHLTLYKEKCFYHVLMWVFSTIFEWQSLINHPHTLKVLFKLQGQLTYCIYSFTMHAQLFLCCNI